MNCARSSGESWSCTARPAVVRRARCGPALFHIFFRDSCRRAVVGGGFRLRRRCLARFRRVALRQWLAQHRCGSDPRGILKRRRFWGKRIRDRRGEAVIFVFGVVGSLRQSERRAFVARFADSGGSNTRCRSGAFAGNNSPELNECKEHRRNCGDLRGTQPKKSGEQTR